MSILTHTVKFNKEVTFDDSTTTTAAAGVSFVKNPGPGEETASTVTSATVSPADIIEYSVTWVTDPVDGDVVEFQYAGGNYEDSNGEAMDSQDFKLNNCADTNIGANAFIPLGSDSLTTSGGLIFNTNGA